MSPNVHRTEESEEYFFVEGCHILEHWNDPADPDVSIARARVEPGKRTRRHRLVGTTERYLILSGEGQVMLGQSVPQKVTAGSVVLIPAGEEQSIQNTENEDLVFLAICTPRFHPSAYQDTEDGEGGDN